MVGQGVLRECLLDPGVTRVLAIGRAATGQTHAKLEELVHRDFLDFEPVAAQLGGFDACFFCLGVSSAGMSEADYRRVTYDFTLAAATVIARVSPGCTFIYVSGAGTDATEKGRSMWARVKGATENALARLPFARVYLFRPGFIRPLHGITSRTRLYRALYAVAGPIGAILPASLATTTEAMGRAMLRAARDGAPKRVLETRDINELAARNEAG